MNKLFVIKADIAAESDELGLKVPNPYYDEWLDVIFQARANIFYLFYCPVKKNNIFDPL